MASSPIRFKWTLAAGLGLALALPAAPSPATLQPGSARIMKVLSHIERTATRTQYRHRTRINARRGIYIFDCSAMAGWVMRKAVPRARRTITGNQVRRPLARDFYRSIARLRPGQRRGPWYRVPTVREALPGDVVAWVRPRWFPSKNTGHVAFVVERPKPNTGPVRGQLLRIADSTRLPHENDRRGRGRSGFGKGTLLLATDSAGRPTGYGWFGSRSRADWIIPTRIVIGRALR
jgi:hypothetical protein